MSATASRFPFSSTNDDTVLDRMLNGYRHVEVASGSDAAGQLLHEKHSISHRNAGNLCDEVRGGGDYGPAQEGENHDPEALTGMLAAIDREKPGSVCVIKVEDGDDFAGMGGLMGTAIFSRGFAGAVIDGGVRDLAQLRKIGFPVYATGVVPSTSVTHYRFGGADVTLEVAGTTVHDGDIITAGQDVIAVVPRKHAAEVLVRAQQLDYAEHAMYPAIKRLHSILRAVKQFGRSNGSRTKPYLEPERKHR